MNISYDPKQELEELGGGFEFDVNLAEQSLGLTACNDLECPIKTSCPDCSTSLVGGC